MRIRTLEQLPCQAMGLQGPGNFEARDASAAKCSAVHMVELVE
jgi:hypothetical protein